MENSGTSTWAVCLGVFCFWPMIWLAVGYYWGKYGAPITINLPHLGRDHFDEFD